MDNKTLHSNNINSNTNEFFEKSADERDRKEVLHNLPTDFSRKAYSQEMREEYSSILSDEVVLELDRLSAISSTNQRTILLAAFASLVHRNSNDTEVRIAASGSVEGIERIQSTQFTPICIDFSDNPSFEQVLGKLSEILSLVGWKKSPVFLLQIGFHMMPIGHF